MDADAYAWKPRKGHYVLFVASDSFFFYFERRPQRYLFTFGTFFYFRRIFWTNNEGFAEYSLAFYWGYLLFINPNYQTPVSYKKTKCDQTASYCKGVDSKKICQKFRKKQWWTVSGHSRERSIKLVQERIRHRWSALDYRLHLKCAVRY